MTKNNLKVVKTTKAQQAEGNEKNKALDAAIAQITDNFGKGSVMKLGQRRCCSTYLTFVSETNRQTSSSSISS